MFRALGLWLSKGLGRLQNEHSQTQSETQSQKPANSSSPVRTYRFTQFWEKADSTGTTKIREQSCAKHKLHAWMSGPKDTDYYCFICVKCGAAYYVTIAAFRRNFTDAYSTDVESLYQTEPAERKRRLRSARDSGVLRVDDRNPTPTEPYWIRSR